jgi:hypothetical protein
VRLRDAKGLADLAVLLARPGREVHVRELAVAPVPEGGPGDPVLDERADETFQVNGDPLQRLLYGFSVLHCLPVGRDAQPSAATGALMRPATLARHAEQAGFGSVEVLGVDDPMFRLYRLRG